MLQKLEKKNNKKGDQQQKLFEKVNQLIYPQISWYLPPLWPEHFLLSSYPPFLFRERRLAIADFVSSMLNISKTWSTGSQD